MKEYTFRWDEELSVLWAGERSYPARFHRHSMHDDIPDASGFLLAHPDYRMETRQCWVHFENQWTLSTIWGDATYSSNRIDYSGLERQPFIEEPTLVEVGVIPPGDELWGNPLAYVSVPEYHRLADMVMMLPFDIDLPEGEWDENATAFCDFLITAGLERTL